MRRWFGWAIAVATATASLAVSAQNYPAKPIRMIIPFAPGGASDLVGRMIAQRLSELIGQQIVADNRAGADGNVGVQLTARSQPDGYTLLLGNVGAVAINPGIYPDFPVKPVRDLIAVSQVVDVPGVLVLNPTVPANTVKEFIEYARARPGKINFASPGSSAATRLEMEFFMRAAGIRMVHIPYKGGGSQAAASVVAGETSIMFTLGSVAMPHVKAARLKMLGVLAHKRLPTFPDAPTMAEAGFPSMVTGSWQGAFVPARTPQPIVAQLFKAISGTMGSADVRKRLNDTGVEVVVSRSPEEFAAFVKAQTQRWEAVIREAGIVAE